MAIEPSRRAFDCMEWIRGVRGRISTEIQDLPPEELQKWFGSRRPPDPLLAKLFGRSDSLEPAVQRRAKEVDDEETNR